MRFNKMRLTAIFEKVPEGYIAFVEELPGANTQGSTIEEARTNLQEAVGLVLEANRILAEEALFGRDVIREPFVIASA
jgi:predicted RNase H-like HicB family nuclease